MSNWSVDDFEKLIEIVREERVLWYKAHNCFYQNDRKANVWKRISDEHFGGRGKLKHIVIKLSIIQWCQKL